MSLGMHWIAEVSTDDPAAMRDKHALERFLIQLPEALGLKRVHPPVLQQDGNGDVRGVVLLAASHASAHTDIAHGLVFVDLFSCVPFERHQARDILLQTWPGTLLVDRIVARGDE